MPSAVTLTAATSTLTSTGNFSDTQTAVVGGKTYTFQTTLTNVDGNVLIGASRTASHQNFMDAINLTGTAGTQYATAMTLNAEVVATSATATTTVVKAKTAGSVGNLIATTDTLTNCSWTSTVMAGGAGTVGDWATSAMVNSQMNSDVINLFRHLTPTAD